VTKLSIHCHLPVILSLYSKNCQPTNENKPRLLLKLLTPGLAFPQTSNQRTLLKAVMSIDLRDRPEDIQMSTQFSTNQPKNTLTQKVFTSTALVALGAGLAWGGQYLSHPSLRESATENSPATTLLKEPNTTVAETAPQTIVPSNFVAQVVREVGPAVVRIDAQRTVENAAPEMFNDPFFRRFFGDQIPNIPDKQIQSGIGSGFILNKDGQIITNAHVVDGADKVTVVLKDGRQFEGKVMGRDPVTDVAVVKIEAHNLPTVKLGDSERLQPGDWAITIGNPLGLDNTVTTGIISAVGRSSSEVGVPDKRVDFIQTDAAINPGNSGGPLLNAQGEVIGMNTAILQGAQGLGFAIPINTVDRIAEELIANGTVKHPYLGIQMVTLTPEVKEQLNNNPNSGLFVNEDQGVLIVRVMPGSPADNAGLRAGDVIEQINQQPVQNADDVQQAVIQARVGNQLKLGLRRNGEPLSIQVKAGEFSSESSQ